MRIIAQLLREFWLPLLLAFGWTIFNFTDRPVTQWAVRDFINVFGPTFFFVSWLVAQWYRVRKQQRVEDGLLNIQQDVRSIQEPLLPIRLFVTLAHKDVEERNLATLFEGAPGYREFSPDMSTPPPPIGPPEGTKDARVFGSNKYLDFKDGAVVAAGFFKSKHPGLNTIHREIEHTFCSLPEDGIKDSLELNHPLLARPSAKLSITFRDSRKKLPVLSLVSGTDPGEVTDVRALDDSVFVDHFTRMTPASYHQSQSFSVTDLGGASIDLKLDFFFLQGVSDLPEESWPTMHNLQLMLGRDAQIVFSFSSEMLTSQTTTENPEPIAHGMARCVQISLQYRIDEDTVSDHLLSW